MSKKRIEGWQEKKMLRKKNSTYPPLSHYAISGFTTWLTWHDCPANISHLMLNWSTFPVKLLQHRFNLSLCRRRCCNGTWCYQNRISYMCFLTDTQTPFSCSEIEVLFRHTKITPTTDWEQRTSKKNMPKFICNFCWIYFANNTYYTEFIIRI